MTNEQIIEKLIDQINNDMQIFIAVLSIVIAIAAFLQWRISDKQIHKMQMAIREANDKAEKLAKMNKILIKNSALAIARNQFLIGFPDWRSDIEFFEYIKDKILVYVLFIAVLGVVYLIVYVVKSLVEKVKMRRN